MTSPAYLHGLATAVPPHKLDQTVVQTRASDILGPKYPQFARLAGTFATAGIETRYSCAPLDWFSEPRGWEERNDLFLTGAVALFQEAARKALAAAGWQAAEVDTVVSVTSTGIATPTLEARASAALGFRADVMRVPIFGLGCAGGVSGLAVAQALATARPASKVLLVVVEACTLSFRSDRLQKADIIATALFGDGAAAACISTDQSDISIWPGHQHMWPDSLRIMGWDVDNTGLGVVFDRAIPGFVTEQMAEAAQGALAAFGRTASDIDRFVCHPGGAKVIEALETALDLTGGSLDAERDLLRRYGNMSAPTVFFVLDDVLNSGKVGSLLMAALGPGFTASFVPLLVAA